MATTQSNTIHGPFPDGNWCVKCHRFQHQPGTADCKNPSWHDLPPDVDPNAEVEEG